LRVSGASEPGSEDVPNEDWWGATSSVIVVLDGVTVPGGMASGCKHGTPWYVHQLGIRLLSRAALIPDMPLDEILGAAITAVAQMHWSSCDLSSLGSPSAAVAMLRADGSSAEYLALADVTIALEAAGGLQVITDDRVAATVADVVHAGADQGEQIAERRETHRNRPGGYWVAAADPEAAANAVTGTVTGLTRAAVLTDGASRAADMFGESWEFTIRANPEKLIREVRSREGFDPRCEHYPRFKVSDDATAVTWQA